MLLSLRGANSRFPHPISDARLRKALETAAEHGWVGAQPALADPQASPIAPYLAVVVVRADDARNLNQALQKIEPSTIPSPTLRHDLDILRQISERGQFHIEIDSPL